MRNPTLGNHGPTRRVDHEARAARLARAIRLARDLTLELWYLYPITGKRLDRGLAMRKVLRRFVRVLDVDLDLALRGERVFVDVQWGYAPDGSAIPVNTTGDPLAEA